MGRRPLLASLAASLLLMHLGWPSSAAAASLRAPVPPAPAEPGPSVVTITGANFDYTYTVNGEPEVIQGMGYNADYRRLPLAERIRRYDQDFSRFRDAGVNTVLGWAEYHQSDPVLLERAQAAGLGVVIPFYLDPHGPYQELEYRRQVQEAVTAWVEQFRDYPALRMWNLGAEIFEALPEADAEGFATFYVELVDLVHQLDPNHPVLYQGAEDLGVGRLRASFSRDGVHRPWFVYGININTFRLGPILSAWPQQGWDVPVVASRFGPLGLGPTDRPAGYLKMWRLVRSQPAFTLGGFVFVWSANSPDPVEEAFGLVDGHGTPTDATLDFLSLAFRPNANPEGAEVASFVRWVSMLAPPVPVGPNGPPSIVSVWGRNYRYSYKVNGESSVIRGMGYNAMYNHLPLEERAQRYDRDFRKMREMGINTILGWGEQRLFDELTLAKAHEHGLGVVMPYYLDPFGDYQDTAYRQWVKEDVTKWVLRFKDFPALRIWGLGNEVLHMLDPEEAQLFCRFYLELADLVRSLDRNHPVVYRGAEDFALEPLVEALNGDGRRRPWLMYGMNIFTFRIAEALENWPNLGWDAALLFSEFGPMGYEREDRPRNLVQMWRIIRSQPSVVLGGFIYVWSTIGPEKVDQAFGLVDGDGNLVDGTLTAIARAFRQDSRALLFP